MMLAWLFASMRREYHAAGAGGIDGPTAPATVSTAVASAQAAQVGNLWAQVLRDRRKDPPPAMSHAGTIQVAQGRREQLRSIPRPRASAREF